MQNIKKNRDLSGHEVFDFIPYPMVITTLEGEVVYLNQENPDTSLNPVR